jgi:hypothetical protein
MPTKKQPQSQTRKLKAGRSGASANSERAIAESGALDVTADSRRSGSKNESAASSRVDRKRDSSGRYTISAPNPKNRGKKTFGRKIQEPAIKRK